MVLQQVVTNRGIGRMKFDMPFVLLKQRRHTHLYIVSYIYKVYIFIFIYYMYTHGGVLFRYTYGYVSLEASYFGDHI